MKPITYIPYNGSSTRNRNRRRMTQFTRILGMIALMTAAGYVLHVMGGLEAAAGLR